MTDASSSENHRPPGPDGAAMRASDGSIPDRLRIVVVGPSVGFFVRPPRASSEEGNYGEVLERRLRAEGIDASVVNSARWFLLVHEAFQRIEDLVLGHTPHVVITNFGMGECQPKVFPTSVLRWLHTWRPNSSIVSRGVRRVLVSRFNAAYVTYSPRLIRALPSVPYRVSPKRFELEMSRFVDLVRKERQALVLMLTANPAGEKLEAILPGTDERAQRYNGIMSAVAARHGDDVRIVDARGLVLSEGMERVLPDGIHFNAQGHALVADALFAEIMAWRAARASSHSSRPRTGISPGQAESSEYGISDAEVEVRSP